MRTIRNLPSYFTGAICALVLAASPMSAATATNPICAEATAEIAAGEMAHAKIPGLLPPPNTKLSPDSPQAKALCAAMRDMVTHGRKLIALQDKAIEACAGTAEEKAASRGMFEQLKTSAGMIDQDIAAICGVQ